MLNKLPTGFVMTDTCYAAPTLSRVINSNKQKFKEHQDPAAVLDVKAAYLDINRVPPHRGTFNFISN